MNRSYSDEAVVLKKQDFGEADRLLTLFSRDRGKVKVLAKGVRRPTSRKGGNLDLLNHVQIFVARGKNLDLVTQAQVVNAFSPLKNDVKNISKAYYLCEITDRLCAEEVPSKFIFDLLVETLDGFLNRNTQKIWDYEYKLLEHLGFMSESQSRVGKGLRSYVEEIIERELSTPRFYHALLALDNS